VKCLVSTSTLSLRLAIRGCEEIWVSIEAKIKIVLGSLTNHRLGVLHECLHSLPVKTKFLVRLFFYEFASCLGYCGLDIFFLRQPKKSFTDTILCLFTDWDPSRIRLLIHSRQWRCNCLIFSLLANCFFPAFQLFAVTFPL